MELADGRVRGQRPDNRVFPPAATDHKYSHAPGAYLLACCFGGAGKRGALRGEAALSGYRRGRSWRVWSRRGPTPIALTGAPDRSSTALT